MKMPGLVDWKTSPLVIVDQMFQERCPISSGGDKKEWSKMVEKFFTEKITLSEWKNIPSLNSSPSHSLVNGQIVRFRGMIQDMFDPELYLSEYEYRDVTSGEVRRSTSRFRETTVCGEDDINFNSPATKNGERLSYFCVAVPGEAAWAVEEFRRQAVMPETASSSSYKRDKRSRDEDDEDQMDVSEATLATAQPHHDAASMTDFKKSRTGPPDQPMMSETETVTSSLMTEDKPISVIVKLYDLEEGALALNDAVEFIGILSVDPAMAQFGFEDASLAGNGVSAESDEAVASEHDITQQFDRKELMARNPPSSLVPRLHVLHYFKMDAGNPLLPISDTPEADQQVNLGSVRAELHAYLTHLLLGDTLAAEYLLCHLVSKIYLRRDVLCLGKFSVNLFQVPLTHNYAKRVSEKLGDLVCKSRYHSLTVDSLNKMVYVPKKDYEANRLTTGLLQLSPHTHLFLNETTLECGQLDAEGVRNLTALGNLITWQKCAYNFSFHNIDFQTDIPCLVFSEGRSMLSCDVQILLKPEGTVGDIDQMLNTTTLGQESSNQIRKYISFVRHLAKFDVSDEMQKFVQEDFVQERSVAGGAVSTPDDLHSLLVFSRLLSLSHGHSSLTEDIWRQAKSMEASRKARMAHLPSRAH